MKGKLIDLIEQRFGRWTVLKFTGRDKKKNDLWLCRCECGKEKIVRGSSLRSGNSKGCKSCFATKHGQWGTSLHNVWTHIVQRCENSNNKRYKDYGGRGIKVCSEWRKDFVIFMKWALFHGYKEGLTLDRINNDGNYEPENCQFLTRSENTQKAWHVDGSYGKKYLKAS